MHPRLRTISLAIIGSAALAGCSLPSAKVAPDPFAVGNLPENIVALAAPDQDLSTARLLREDNCYWYMHAGPVETTLLPLRAVGGRPICVALQPAA